MNMKKKLLFGLCITALFAGCTQDIDEVGPTISLNGAPQIQINGSIDQTYSTRVDDGGFCDGDQIGLYGVNYTDNNSVAGELLDEGNQVDYARYTFDEANWKWVSSGNIYYKDAETHIDLYGYYPYGSVNSVSEYAFEVEQDQSGGNAVDGYAMSDFLWGKTENVTPSENKVKIKFNHKMACANVILTEGDGFEIGEFERLEKGVLVMNTTRTSTIDLSTGEVTAVGDAPMEGIVMKNNTEGFRAIVVPQTVAAGKALFSITIDGIAYRFKKDVDFTYEQGKQSKFTIKINKKKHSGEYKFILTDTEIVDWIADLDPYGDEAKQYYVVHCEEAGMLEKKLAEAKKNPAKIKNLKVMGEICAADFYFIRDNMSTLQGVNLKEAEITPSWRYRICFEGENLHDEYFPGIKPENESDCQAAVKERYPDKNIIWSDCNQYSYAHEIPERAFENTLISTFVFPEYLTKIGDGAFYKCQNLSGALIIPDMVEEIGCDAFYKCQTLTSLSLPINCKKIGHSAFYYCTSLSGSLILPSTLKSIGYNAFRECSNLTGELVLPEGLEELGSAAFSGCSGFRGDLRIPESITKIEGDTFGRCQFDGRLILHDGIKSIGDINGYGQVFGGFSGELVLPKEITYIQDDCFKGCGFSSIASLPETIQTIGANAFGDCRNLRGVIEIPEGVVRIESGAFGGCNNLEGIILPTSLTVIEGGAFKNCVMLNKIVCKSIEPPLLLDGAFDNVPKDNFTVEVPSRSVKRYQQTYPWSEFKRIGDYYDFSISRRLMRTLNAEHTRKFVLRAQSGFAWSVESKPDWVTVTPSSGVGKAEVTITVGEMTAEDIGSFEITTGSQWRYNNPIYETETHAGRAGEIVFRLDEKDSRVTMSVEQYDYMYGDGDTLVNLEATKGNGVNVVFMGDCFDARDIANGNYLTSIENAISHLFDIEPYKSYKDYFNISTIFGMSNDSGMGTEHTIRDAKFGTQYTGIDLFTSNPWFCLSITEYADVVRYAGKTGIITADNLDESLIVVLENSESFDSCTFYFNDTNCAISLCGIKPSALRQVVQHEIGGHGFGRLADEHPNTFVPYDDYFYEKGKERGYFRNVSDTGDVNNVPWSHFIFNPQYSDEVDVFEGAMGYSRFYFRSEYNSCMTNEDIPYYSAISRQAIVERIMDYAGEVFDINEFYAKDVH